MGTKGPSDGVELGLRATIRLPARFEKGWDGTDVVVHHNKDSRPFTNAINVYGRNAKVSPKIKEQLVAKWPEKFYTDSPS
jgi:hypothetical protein